MRSAGATARYRRFTAWSLDEHADVADQAVVVALEQKALGTLGEDTVDLEELAELDERHPVRHRGHPVHLHFVALQRGDDAAEEVDVALFTLDAIAERAVASEAFVGEGGGKSIPIVGRHACQVALNCFRADSAHRAHVEPSCRSRYPIDRAGYEYACFNEVRLPGSPGPGPFHGTKNRGEDQARPPPVNGVATYARPRQAQQASVLPARTSTDRPRAGSPR